MPTPSPDVFVGRSTELATLSAGALGVDSSAVLIGGDAGVGKTRLLREFATRMRAAGATVMVGHCLDLGDRNAPYLPIAEMFGRLAVEHPKLSAGLAARRPLLAPVLPDTPGQTGPHPPADQGAFFDTVHLSLEDIARQAPLVVLIEDAHWADHATRDLLTFLFTRQFRGSVTLVVTYRADDLHRRHPLRSRIAEWARLASVTRITLRPLSDRDVRKLIRLLRPDVAATAQAAAIVSRAGGNPFFVEELLAATGADGFGLSDELADLLLVRVDALEPVARTVVRAASVAGRTVDHPLLAAVLDLSPTELDGALRTVIDANLVEVSGSGGYTFRHALLAEAVYDDLLPGERVRWHAAYARALRDRTDAGGLAALARHARAAGELDLALDASVRAGDAAVKAFGPADAAGHYEEALTVLAERPDLPAPVDPTELVLRTAAALVAAANPHRAADLLQRALRHHDGDRADRAKLVAPLVDARLLADLPDDGLDLVSEAIGWLGDRESSPTLARLYAVRSRALIRSDDFDGAVLAATEAETIAHDLDLTEVETDAKTSLARLLDLAGDPEASVRALRGVIERARHANTVPAELRGLHQLARVHARSGDLRAALTVVDEALQRAAATGLVTNPFAVDARLIGAHFSYLLGEWDRAQALLDVGMTLPERQHAVVEAVRMPLAVGQGRPDALAQLPMVRRLWRQDVFVAIHSAGAAIDHHGFAGDLDAMLEVYDDVVAALGTDLRMPLFEAQIRLAAQALGHLASAGGRGVPVAGQREESLTGTLEAVATGRPGPDPLGPESAAWLARGHAEAARLRWAGDGRPSRELAQLWSEAVQAFDAAGIIVEAAWCRLHLAQALAGRGEREQARELVEAAAVVARASGAQRLLRATGLIGEDPTEHETHLTGREREVLALLVEGLTNGEIAGKLFISPKTASVHVSNILGKLGATTRTEAATIATRTGLI